MRDPLTWLEKELPAWRQRGLIQEGQEKPLLDYYRMQRPQASHGLVVILFGIIGSLLIGGGLMLIIAHNWPSWPRSVRAGLSVAPMMACQGLVAWVLRYRTTSIAWRESISLAWICSVGAGIALVSQTYHMPGSMDRFLLTWMLLSLPVVYLLNSVSALVFYVAGVTQWSFTAKLFHGVPQAYWLLLGAVLPLMVAWNRATPHGGKATLARWCFIISACAGLITTLDIERFSAWYLVFGLFAGMIWLAGSRYEASARSAWMRPGINLGGSGLAIIFYIMTWDDFWRRVLEARPLPHILQHAEKPSLAVVAALILAYGTYWSFALLKRDRYALAWGSIPLAYLVLSNLLPASSSPFLLSTLVSFSFMALGVWSLVSGVRNDHLGRINTGMLMVCFLIMARFFDAQLPILLRALVFIGIGLAFLLVNVRVSRRRREARR